MQRYFKPTSIAVLAIVIAAILILNVQGTVHSVAAAPTVLTIVTDKGITALDRTYTSPTVLIPNGLIRTIDDHKWSPDGTHIAYVFTDRLTGSVNLAVSASDGGNEFVVGRGLHGYQYDFSPQGTFLAFSDDIASAEDGHNTLHIANVMTGEVISIAAVCANPDWNPVDANLIACASMDTDVPGVSVISPDGTPVAALSSRTDTAKPGGWSPDGGMYMFWRYSSDVGALTLWVTTRDAWKPKLIGAGFRADTSLPVVWEPGGEFITFVGSLPGESAPLSVVVEIATGRPVYIYGANGFVWSPDGASAAFYRSKENAYSIFVAGKDGSQEHVVENVAGWDPQWVPLAMVSNP